MEKHGQGDREVDLAAMQAGAADYLDKAQLSGPLLERSIRYGIERKRAREALRKERDRAQTYLDIAGVLFVALDKEGTVTLINDKA